MAIGAGRKPAENAGFEADEGVGGPLVFLFFFLDFELDVTDFIVGFVVDFVVEARSTTVEGSRRPSRLWETTGR